MNRKLNLGKITSCVAAMFTLALFSQQAVPAGFYLAEVGSPASLGTGGVANPTNTFGADSAWTNPAGMTGLNEDTIFAGVQLLVPKIEFSSSTAVTTGPVPGVPISGNDGGNAGDIAAIPSFFYVKPLSDKARFGFSVVAPMGGGIDYGEEFVGRYAVTKVELTGLGVTPSFAYEVNERLSLGAGITMLYTTLDMDIALRQPGMTDARIKFDGLDDIAWQGVLGLTYKISDSTLLGVVYRSEAGTDLEGDFKIENLFIPLSPQRNVTLSWDNPQWLEAGIRHSLGNGKTVAFNLGWQEWSAFSKNYIDFSGGGVGVIDRMWDDTWHAGVAYKQKLNDKSLYALGFSYESSPVEDDKRTLDFAMDEIYKLSGAYVWKSKQKFDYAIGTTLYLVGDAPIDQTSQGVRVVGDFDNNMILFIGGTLRYIF